MRCLVYGLCTTASDEIRYVGQTSKSLSQRYCGHLRAARMGSKQRAPAWIRGEWAKGNGIRIKVLVADAVWNDDEARIIAELRAAGADLLNIRPGGSCGALKARITVKSRLVKRAIASLSEANTGAVLGGTVGLEGRKRLTTAEVACQKFAS